MKLITPTLFIFLLLTACSDRDDCCTVISTTQYYELQDTAGNNLLVQAAPNAIPFDQVEVYFGLQTTTPQYEAHLDAPKSIWLDREDPTRPVAVLYPNMDVNEAYPITLVKWRSTDIDTIICHNDVRNDDSYIVTDSVWINGVLRFPQAGLDVPRFLLVK